jgi:ATP-dependent RNA helicase RhlE
MNFDELKLNPQLIEAIGYANYVKATPIQELSIPIILEGRDIIGCAQTGTGKTAAFALPVMSKLLEKETNKIQALVIVPTRELAIQIVQWMFTVAAMVSPLNRKKRLCGRELILL